MDVRYAFTRVRESRHGSVGGLGSRRPVGRAIAYTVTVSSYTASRGGGAGRLRRAGPGPDRGKMQIAGRMCPRALAGVGLARWAARPASAGVWWCERGGLATRRRETKCDVLM